MNYGLNDGLGELRPLFPTVMIRRRLDHLAPLNDRLRAAVMDCQTASAEPLIIDRNRAETRAFSSEILAAGRVLAQSLEFSDGASVREIGFAGDFWAAVQGPGEFGKTHDQIGAGWAGYYFVCTGGSAPAPAFQGILEFDDPRPGMTPGGTGECVTPDSGLLIIFPRWLSHRIKPFFGTGERVYLGFELEFAPVQERSGRPGHPLKVPAPSELGAV